jgi:hypothetical protein
MSDKLQTTKGAAVAVQDEVKPSDLLSAITGAVVNLQARGGEAAVLMMERLLAMHERITGEQQKTAFMAAMSRLQAKLPQINKDGRIVVKGTERSRYARIEDIDLAIRPLLAEEGFAFSFDSDSSDAKMFRLSAKLSHSSGHSETKWLTLPLDSSEYRTTVQSIGSTLSYGKRYLIKMHLNIVERLEDDDGNGGASAITADQAKDIDAMIGEVKADKERFLKYMGVDSIESILARDHLKAIQALEAKRRK